jgi:hypothetical protein
VLRARDHALTQILALHPARERHAQRAHQIGVLAVRLGHPAPPSIPGDVHHRRQRVQHSHRPHLAPHDVRHLLNSVGVPRRRQPDRGGKRGEARRHHTVERLVVEDRRDLQARLGEEIPLDRVDALGDLVRQLVAEQAYAGDMADAPSDQAVHLTAHRPVGGQQCEGND